MNALLRGSGADPVRVALVGHGVWGARLCQGILREPTMELCWICDRDPAHLPRGVGDAVSFTTRISDVLAAPEVEALLIAVGPAENGSLALSALRAGKHVLIEKPFATDLAVGRTLAREAAERRLVAGVGHILRYHPAFQAVDRLLAEGELGALFGFVSERLGPHRRPELDSWWVQAPHDLSLAAAWLGPATCTVQRDGRFVEAELDFERGGWGRLRVGRDERSRRRVLLLGERAVVEVGEVESKLCLRPLDEARAHGLAELLTRARPASFSRLSEELESRLSRLPARILSVPSGDALLTELRAFSRAVRSSVDLATSAQASLPVLEMLVRGTAPVRERKTRALALA